MSQRAQNSETILTEMVATIRKQARRILNYLTAGRPTNRRMEGINSIVQATNAKARGDRSDRSDRYRKWMIYNG